MEIHRLQLQLLALRYFDTACKNSPHVRDVLYICLHECGLRLSVVEALGGVKEGECSSVKFLRELMDFFLSSSQAKHFVALN